MRWPRRNGRHWNFYVSAAAGLLTGVLTLVFAPDLFPAVAVSIFSLTYLVLTARELPRLTPDYLRDHAGDEDAPPLIVFLLTIGIVGYAMAALFMAVNDKDHNPLQLTIGVLSVALAWGMIHTMWGMHYAWEYYSAPEQRGSDRRQRGGLDFPGDEEPDGSDFLYYSLVIGMTDQTSDTEVTSRAMRRITTGHSLFSYLFNTVVVAAAVNIVVQLAQG